LWNTNEISIASDLSCEVAASTFPLSALHASSMVLPFLQMGFFSSKMAYEICHLSIQFLLLYL